MLRVATARPVVEAIVVGTSAGALSALTILLSAFTGQPTLPVIIVVHLAARQPSLLVEVFARKTTWPVREPYHGQAIEPGIWFCPPGYHLLIEADRTFALSVDEPVNYSRPSIDVLFHSAAQVYGKALVGVVLTGASADGADGAVAIVDAGGLVVVQDPASAECSLMPAQAIARAKPQFVGRLDEMAPFLAELTRSTAC